MMKDYIKEIIKLFVNNDYSQQTRKQVQHWLSEDKHSEEKNAALKALWAESDKHTDYVGLQRSLQRMKKNIGATAEKPKSGAIIWKVAACLLLVISSASTYMAFSGRKASTDYVESYTGISELKELSLSDGTIVTMNSGSTLIYPETFNGKTRCVHLIGEARFKVAKNAKKPFIVKANDFQVTALGTEFNVEAYQNQKIVSTTLIEGCVRVEYNNLSSSVILSPNQQLAFNRTTRESALTTPCLEDVTAWERGEIVFSNERLEDIFIALEYKYPYTFICRKDALNNNTYSFRFGPDANLDQIMKIITKVAGDISYRIKEDHCYIESK